jgi:hypothetical protein
MRGELWTTHYGRPPGMQSPRSAHSAHSGNKSIVATDAAITERPMSERMDKNIPMKTIMVVDRIREKNKAGDEEHSSYEFNVSPETGPNRQTVSLHTSIVVKVDRGH